MVDERNHILVIGGGAAGIIAAWRAAVKGSPVTILERNGRLGTKILISGGGRCNVTHVGSVNDLLAAFTLSEQRFLKNSLHRFTNLDIWKLLESQGVALAPRPDGRVFPISGTARDVMRALSRILQQHNISVRFHQRVQEIVAENAAVTGVRVGATLLPADRVVLATGGSSYPQTGTTGDGYAMACSLGHTIVPIRPALAPIRITPPVPHAWRGVAIRNACLSVWSGDRKIMHWDGDLLLTHDGISGPAALEVSRAAAVAAERAPVDLAVDFFPENDPASMDRDLQAVIRDQGTRMVSTLLEPWLPNRMIEGMLRGADVDPSTRGLALTREKRSAIVGLLKNWRIGRVASVPIERGEVTAGGVALNEVEPRTMHSRLVRGLYLCGEVLDVAGPVGGYNLQAAFSTGFVAGESAAMDSLSGRALHAGWY